MTSLPPPCIGGRKQPVQSSTNHLQSTLPRRASTPFPMHRTRARALRLQHVSPQGSVQRSLVGHPALCTSSTLGLGTQRTQLENHARTACRTPPRPLVGHPALCTSSTLALEPANAPRHECRANAFEDIATNRLRYPPAASRPTFRAPFPRRSPCALHFVDPGRPACECHAAQTRANTFAEIATNRPRLPPTFRSPIPQSVTQRFALRRPWPSSLRIRRHTNAAQTPSPTSPPTACTTHRLRLPNRPVHRSLVGHPALCTSSTPALVRRIQKVASSMHTRADQSHERDPPPIGNVNKTRPGPARRIHANPP